jgi:hypothetical protein
MCTLTNSLCVVQEHRFGLVPPFFSTSVVMNMYLQIIMEIVLSFTRRKIMCKHASNPYEKQYISPCGFVNGFFCAFLRGKWFSLPETVSATPDDSERMEFPAPAGTRPCHPYDRTLRSLFIHLEGRGPFSEKQCGAGLKTSIIL